MIPSVQFDKIKKAIEDGKLKIRILSKEEYEKIEKEYKEKKLLSLNQGGFNDKDLVGNSL